MTKDMSRLRNVVLAGHSDSGKTTLAEHLLHTAGAINRLGKVDDGTALLDFEPEEQKRKQSLSLALATTDHNDYEITLLDTPGYEPTSRGMAAARPFITTFISVHDSAGLARLARLVRVRR